MLNRIESSIFFRYMCMYPMSVSYFRWYRTRISVLKSWSWRVESPFPMSVSVSISGHHSKWVPHLIILLEAGWAWILVLIIGYIWILLALHGLGPNPDLDLTGIQSTRCRSVSDHRRYGDQSLDLNMSWTRKSKMVYKSHTWGAWSHNPSL